MDKRVHNSRSSCSARILDRSFGTNLLQMGKKSVYLITAEKEVLAKRVSRALFELACKPQDAVIRLRRT